MELAERTPNVLAEEHSTKELSDALWLRIQAGLGEDTFAPTLDRVLVKALTPPDWQKEGALYVVRDEKKQHRYLVVAIGPGRRLDNGSYEPPEVEVGDIVLAGAYSGHPITIQREDFRLIKQSDVLAVITE